MSDRLSETYKWMREGKAIKWILASYNFLDIEELPCQCPICYKELDALTRYCFHCQDIF